MPVSLSFRCWRKLTTTQQCEVKTRRVKSLRQNGLKVTTAAAAAAAEAWEGSKG